MAKERIANYTMKGYAETSLGLCKYPNNGPWLPGVTVCASGRSRLWWLPRVTQPPACAQARAEQLGNAGPQCVPNTRWLFIGKA